MNFNKFKELEKKVVFEQIASFLKRENLTIIEQDQTRPWGGFFVIDEQQTKSFILKFFPDMNLSEMQLSNKLSPKILIIAPHKRLSWQYHFRRSEIWRILSGSVGVKTSVTNEEDELQTLLEGDVIKIDKEERHRIIGLDSWGIVAEIWQHNDSENPSDEDDIVRLQDDFGR
ncbi:phosphoheptose isomerase [Flavobacterium sp.]|uniref:phosphoheptose isomerase n=1 Tax=Flavobacterium sp. TaxID=239 RepID=UPI003C39EC3B